MYDKSRSVFRLAALSLIAATPFLPAVSFAQTPSTATQTVDVMNKRWGRHPGLRANHAKGVVTEGSFTPSPFAAIISKAVIFQGKPVPVTVRFSDSTGLPTVPDGSRTANPHGMSIKFHLDNGGQVDVVTNSLGFFPVATGEDFRDLLQALSVSGPDVPKPTKADQFIAAHPSVSKAFATPKTPASFATDIYNGVDAFIFVDAAGKKQPFRFRFVPVGGAVHLSKEQGEKQAPDFLIDELPQRLARQKVAFHVMAQLANLGDQTKDPTQPWPADRRIVDLGTITLTSADNDQAGTQKALQYLPNRLTPGIEVSDDPLIDARVRAYVISFGRRAQ